MARRPKTNVLDDLMEIVARMPWWAGVALALVSYVLLHRVAEQPAVGSVAPGQVGQAVLHTLGRTFATFGQYLLPLVCLLGALASFVRGRRRAELVSEAANGGAGALNGMNWREFEMLVGEAYRLQGYRVTETGGGGADGGVDLVLTKGGEKFLVQCKQWKAYKVSVQVVRELYGVMAARGAAGGHVVTSGRFTQDAITFAAGRNIELIDGPKLKALIREVQASKMRTSGSSEGKPSPLKQEHVLQTAGPPACPVCSHAMVMRTAQRGANAGNRFWGCSSYPKCRGTRTAD